MENTIIKGVSLKSDTSNTSFTENSQDSHSSENPYSPLPTPHSLCLWSWLQRVWQRLIQELTSADELKVWEKRDRKGNTYWEAYDPMTGKHFYSGSGADMIAWMEQLYTDKCH